MSREPIVDEDTLRDLASSACQEALSFGVNEDVFMRLARTVELLARDAAPQNDESQNVARIDNGKAEDLRKDAELLRGILEGLESGRLTITHKSPGCTAYLEDRAAIEAAISKP